MKKLIKNTIFALLLFVGANVDARDIDVKVNDGQTLEIALEEKGTLVLLDRKGEILFKESCVSGNSYKRLISLSEIPFGTYFLKFEKEDSVLTSVITKDREGVKVDRTASSIAFKPIFKIEDSRVMFILTNPAEMKARMKVYDSEGLLVGEATGSDFVFKKTLDFSMVPKGDYTISLRLGDNDYMKTISL